jgi:energy-coupling factor transporter ATP-binding protein EcfA2
MRISKIKVPIEETRKVNLKEINLTKKDFGSTVALIGKNGAGKSRILNFVENYYKTITGLNYFEEHFKNIPTEITSQFYGKIKEAQLLLSDIENIKLNSHLKKMKIEAAISLISPIVQRFQQLAPAYIKKVDSDDLQNIKTVLYNNFPSSFEELLTNSHFDNIVNNINQSTILNPNQQKIGLLNEFNYLNNNNTISYFNNLASEIVVEEYQLYFNNKENLKLIEQEIKKKKSYKLFNKFQGYVKQFLGKDFSYQPITYEDRITSKLHFNDAAFDIKLLSPGQKTLFAYAILFFYLDTNSKTNLRDSIIIIDEPEKHLHPEAQIILINALKNIVGKTGQLWIATHSIHILSHLEFDEIMMVKDDEILPPSRTTPGKSFNDLMGIEEHIDELVTFINSISEWAYSNFMVQCFKEPDVIFGKNINDPQFKLFKEFLINKTNVNLLDFGAGKGRIGYTIQEDEIVSKKISYSAYAYKPEKRDLELLNNVPNIKAVYSDISKIQVDSFDCVVLCNVLHEINPKEWITTLSSIKNILNDNGFLIIIEDRFLPKGETAHEFGYLIFTEEEMKILLNTNNSINLKLEETEFRERIIFNVFKKSEINPTKESVIESVKTLNYNSFNNLKLLKKANKDLNQGRRYANETQLFINSQLALESLNK